MLLDILFPKVCINCQKMGKYICHSCFLKAQLIEFDLCPYCNKPSILGKKHYKCVGELDGVLSIFRYSGFIKTFIKTVKYKLQYAVWDEMISLIPEERVNPIRTLGNELKNAVIQVIPLHSKRLKERGFNQVDPFAKYITNVLCFERVDLIKRSKNTQSQATLHSKELRMKNIQNSFETNNRLKDISNISNVILLDDVYTTGYTCNEAAKVLKRMGVNRVFAITVAKG